VPPPEPLPAPPAGVADGRGRFREIYRAVREDHGRLLPDDLPCDEALRRAPDEPPPTGRAVRLGPARAPLRILVVPGLYGECVADLVTPFAGALEHLEEAHGYRVGLLPVSGRSSSARNAVQIRDFLAALPPEPGEKIVLVGYSKGVCDALEAVAGHNSVRRRVDAVVGVAGAVGGSALAEGIPEPLGTLVSRADLPGCDAGDGRGIDSLRRSTRRDWLARHALPRSVRYFSLVALPEADRVSAILRPGHRRIAEVDSRNDGHVVWADAFIPAGTFLGYANADHWAVALPIVRAVPLRLRAAAATVLDRNAFPREVLLEAIVRHVEEELAAPDPLRSPWNALGWLGDRIARWSRRRAGAWFRHQPREEIVGDAGR
jgi:hypothetical protein